MIARELAMRAAQLLERDAAALRQCHTIKGEWKDELEAEADYHEMMSVALELRRHAGE